MAAPVGTELREVPGDPGLPVVGNTLRMLKDSDRSWARGRFEKYGPVSWTKMLGRRVVNVTGPEGLGAILVNRDKAYSNELGWGWLIEKFFNRGLMLMDFEEHHAHRRIMQQAFTRDRLVGYLDSMGPVIADGIEAWQPRDGFLVLPAVKQLTLDVATRTFMGEQLGPEADRVNKAFIACVRAGTAMIRTPVPGGRWKAGLDGRRLLEKHFTAYVPRKRQQDGPDLFSALCHTTSEDGDRFSDEDVVNHMIFLLMAAHDTSTITLSAMAYYLAKHPEWQERAREESVALGEDVAYADLDKLHTLDLVMKEALRLVPPVPAFPRVTVKDTELLGFHLPKGTSVTANVTLTHLMPEYWTAPERFDPERFSEGRREDKTQPHLYEPFGGGVHKCIGMHFGTMEVKVAMHHLLRRFRWSVDPAYEMQLDVVALPIPADKLPVLLARL